ncbi:MAG: NifB/NifX family molybdenum-iron cluster-binding protein [Firmicutes bacterium]|nr:NifB/NifX family molybdenum-iron cluster-binding protein [Bacillota bacterium]
MKLAVTAQGIDLDSAIDPRFGRCQYFVIIDPDTEEFEAIANQSLTTSGGAGIQSAQFLADRKVDAVITGNVGPNAARALQGAGIEVYTMTSGTVREAVKAYKEGKLSTVSGATVGPHFGMGSGAK